LERFDPLIVAGDRVFIRQPVIKPLFESRSGLMIFQDLGTRLGLKDFFQYKDELDYLGYQVKPLGVSVEELRQAGSVKVKLPPIDMYLFRTPSGKVELKSSLLAAADQDAVPTWQEPPRPTADAFYLLTGKVAQHTQFATQNNRYLHELEPGNALWMNPGPAAARGLADGETVVVKSRSGEVRVPLRVTEAIRSDCVYLTPGFGHVSKALMTAFGSGVSDSDLHETFTDPVSGGQALSQTFVTVEKV
jgi:thiosulfate reductase/polysulfide reductase chain A